MYHVCKKYLQCSQYKSTAAEGKICVFWTPPYFDHCAGLLFDGPGGMADRLRMGYSSYIHSILSFSSSSFCSKASLCQASSQSLHVVACSYWASQSPWWRSQLNTAQYGVGHDDFFGCVSQWDLTALCCLWLCLRVLHWPPCPSFAPRSSLELEGVV